MISFRKLYTAARSNAYFWPLVMFGTSGLAVTVANILWARALPAHTYAVVAFWLAVYNSAIRLAPFGADLEVVRSHGVVTGASIRHVAATSAATGLVAGLITGLVYGLALAVSMSVAIAIAAGGIISYASAAMQARRRYVPSLLVLHASNYVTLLVAVVSVVIGARDERVIVCVIAVGIAFVLGVSGTALLKLRSASPGSVAQNMLGVLWPLLVITGSYELMMMSDRLTTPLLLSFEDLAALSVLLALVGPPFRLLEMVVPYTLMPEVKAAAARGSASATLRHSAWVAGGLTAAASLGLLLVLGPLSQLLFGDKFETSTSLVVAVVSVGVVRVAHSFAFAAATALVPEDELPGLAFLGTVAAAVVVAGAVVGARWGLHGIIYGAVPGWLFRTGVYASKANMAMRRHIVKLA